MGVRWEKLPDAERERRAAALNRGRTQTESGGHLRVVPDGLPAPTVVAQASVAPRPRSPANARQIRPVRPLVRSHGGRRERGEEGQHDAPCRRDERARRGARACCRREPAHARPGVDDRRRGCGPPAFAVGERFVPAGRARADEGAAGWAGRCDSAAATSTRSCALREPHGRRDDAHVRWLAVCAVAGR